MISWIFNHTRLILGLIGTGFITLISFGWAFILMGYKTEARVGLLEGRINQQQIQITAVDRQISQLIGITSSVKEDTTILKKALIKGALEKKEIK